MLKHMEFEDWESCGMLKKHLIKTTLMEPVMSYYYNNNVI